MGFVARARSSIERGDTLRAVLTLVAGLRRTPNQPDALPLLVELVRDHVDSGGIEHELVQVLTPHPNRDEMFSEMITGLLDRDQEKVARKLRTEGEKRGMVYTPPPDPEPEVQPDDEADEADESGDEVAVQTQAIPEPEPPLAPESEPEEDEEAIAAAQKVAEAEMAARQRVARRERQAKEAARRRRRLMIVSSIALVVGLALVAVYVAGAASRASDLTALDGKVQAFDRFDEAALTAVEEEASSRTDPEFVERVEFARALSGDDVEVRLDGWNTEWGLAASALAAMQKDDLEAAIALVTKVERSYPTAFSGQFARARLEELRGNASEARTFARKVLDRYPGFAPGHEVLVRAEARQLDFDAMRASITSLKAVAPEHPYLGLSSLPHPRKVLLGPTSAREEAVVKPESNDKFLAAAAAYESAVAAGLRADLSGSVASGRRAVGLDPRFAPARLVLGTALAADGHADDAAKVFAEAARDAKSAELRTLLQAVGPTALIGAGRPDLAKPFASPFPKLRGEGVDDRFDETIADQRPELLGVSALGDVGRIPWAPDALYARVQLFIATGDYELARATLDELATRQISPGRARALKHWLTLITAGEADEKPPSNALATMMEDWATGRFRQVSVATLEEPLGWQLPIAVELRASSMLALRQIGPALEALEKAPVGLAYRPTLEGLQLRALARLGHENSAYVELRERLSKPMPTSLPRLLDLAEAAFWQGEFTDAEKWLADAAKIDANHREAAWICALVMRGRNRSDDADACFARSGRDWESSAGLLVELGYLQLQFRRPKQAQELFYKALLSERADVDAARGLGEAYTKLPRDVAQRDLVRIAGSYGDDLPAVRGELQKWLAVVRGVRKGSEEGLQALDAAAAVLGERDDIMMERARYHAAREEWDRARELYAGALRRNTTLADAHVAIARIDLRRGDKDKARQHLQRYLDLEPRGASAAWCRRQLE